MIAVIDYGMGNLRSVQKALEVVGADAKITMRSADLKKAEKIVFPGVGSFGDAMRELKRYGLDDAIRGSIAAGKPFLGLCLGMQLLFDKSEESPGVKGLGILRGEVKRFRPGKGPAALKVPHMGWNGIGINARIGRKERSLLKGVPDGSFMYFVHSYYVGPRDADIVLTSTDYGIRFASGIANDNVYGLQFHPEKSQALGLKILKNFTEIG